MSPEEQKKPIYVQSMYIRPDGMLEVTFMETRKQTDKVFHAETVGIMISELGDDFDELERLLDELVDNILDARNNPPDTIPAR